MADLRIPEDKASEVFELAAQLYARHKQGYPLKSLESAQSRVDIPPEFIQKALNQLQAREEEARELAQKAKLHRRLVSIGAVLAAGALVAWAGLTYSRLSQAARNADSAWAQVENQFEAQSNLLGDLLNQPSAPSTSQELRQRLSQARQDYEAAATQPERLAAIEALKQVAADLQTALIQIPASQRDEAASALAYELNSSGTRIATEGLHYNLAADHYNLTVNSFPTVLLAGPLGFKPKPLFTLSDTQVQ